jgi:hypothetical protein
MGIVIESRLREGGRKLIFPLLGSLAAVVALYFLSTSASEDVGSKCQQGDIPCLVGHDNFTRNEVDTWKNHV